MILEADPPQVGERMTRSRKQRARNELGDDGNFLFDIDVIYVQSSKGSILLISDLLTYVHREFKQKKLSYSLLSLITTCPITEIKKIIGKFYGQLCANKFDNLAEVDKF